MKHKDNVVRWIRNWFNENGPGCNAVIGISGGKDSTVVAALCVEALGKDRVIGVMMPNGKQADIADSIQVCEYLGIKNFTLNIETMYDSLNSDICDIDIAPTEQTMINAAPRLRMTVLYAIAQSCNGRVANTCNFSETYVGWETKYGDAAGDFSPLGNLTVKEVIELGEELGLPDNLIHKTPSDGLCGASDEDKFGFTYEELDNYILYAEEGPNIEKIKRMNRNSVHKRISMEGYEPWAIYKDNGEV